MSEWKCALCGGDLGGRDDDLCRKCERDVAAKKAADAINPAHYTGGGIETIDFIEAKGLDYHLGNVVKYVARAGKKSDNAVEDLRKAQWYLAKALHVRGAGPDPRETTG